MAAESYRHDGTAFRKAKESYRNDGAAWRKCKERWRFDGTAWRKVFSTGSVVLNPLAAGDSRWSAAPGVIANASISFNADGTIAFVGNGDSNDSSGTGPFFWATTPAAGVGASVYIRATVTAGSALSVNSAVGWTLLSTALNFRNGSSTTGIRSSTITFDFSLDGGASIVTSSAGWVISYAH